MPERETERPTRDDAINDEAKRDDKREEIGHRSHFTDEKWEQSPSRDGTRTHQIKTR